MKSSVDTREDIGIGWTQWLWKIYGKSAFLVEETSFSDDRLVGTALQPHGWLYRRVSFQFSKNSVQTVDGVKIQNINPSHLRNHVGLVSQEPVLFDCSIRCALPVMDYS